MTTRVLLQQIFNYLKNEYDVSDWWRNESALEICVGAILVQNTTWRQAHVALKQLITTGNLEINEIKKLDILILQKLIKPSGFYRTKANTLKGFVDLVSQSKDGTLKGLLSLDSENLRVSLLSVKGIGNETADDIILYAAHKPSFVVDKYSQRIFTRYGIQPTGPTYLKWQTLIHDNVDKDVLKFQEFHALLVRLGQDRCKTIPECVDCCLKSVCKTGLKNCM